MGEEFMEEKLYEDGGKLNPKCDTGIFFNVTTLFEIDFIKG